MSPVDFDILYQLFSVLAFGVGLVAGSLLGRF